MRCCLILCKSFSIQTLESSSGCIAETLSLDSTQIFNVLSITFTAMKRKNIYYIIAGVVILIAAGIFYLLYDRDENKISPLVSIPSYNDRLMEEIKRRTEKSFESLSDQEKISVLRDIAMVGMETHRTAAIRLLMDFAGDPVVDQTFLRLLSDSTASVIEEAIYGIEKKKIHSCDQALSELIQRLYQRADASMPTTDIQYLTIIGKSEGGDIIFNAREYQERLAPLNDAKVSEINLFLPQGAYYYCSFPNFDNNWRSFRSSQFVKAFIEQPAYQDLQSLSFTEDFFRFKNIVDQKLGGLGKYFTPEKLFRDDLKYAVYPEGKLIVTFAGKNLEIATSMLKVFHSLGKDSYTFSQTEYHGAKVVHISYARGKRSISYAHAGDYFILSTSPSLLDRSLRTFYTERENSITTLPSFQQSYKAIDLTGEKNFLYMFFEPHSIIRMKGDNKRSKYLLKIALDGLSSLRGTNVTLEQIVGKEKRNDIRSTHLLRSIPKDIIAFDVIEKLQVEKIWKYITQVRMISPDALDSLQIGAHVIIEKEIIPFVNEGGFISYSGIRYGADYESNISAMQFVLGFSSPNVQNLSVSLSNLFQYLFRYPLSKEEYSGAAIYSIRKPEYSAEPESEDETQTTQNVPVKERPISPSFSVLDNILLIGMNPSVIKAHIDAYKGKSESQFSDGTMRELIEQKIIIRSGPFLKNFFSFLRRYARRTTRFTEIEIEERIKPLITLLETNQSIHGWFKELNTIYHGQITIDMK